MPLLEVPLGDRLQSHESLFDSTVSASCFVRHFLRERVEFGVLVVW